MNNHPAYILFAAATLFGLSLHSATANVGADLSDRERAAIALTAKPMAAQPLIPTTYEQFYGPRDLRLPLSGDCANNQQFRSGAALHDTTGPAYDQGMAGYANPVQTSEGLLNRQFARAFIIGSDCTGVDQRVALVSVDLGLTFHAIKQGVVDLIKQDADLADHYDYANIMVTPTHSHATAGGQSHHDLYNLPAFGFDDQAHRAVVTGIFQAIKKAHSQYETASPGKILMAQGELLNATVQRSRPAYDKNPEDERNSWRDVTGKQVTINRNMLLLKLMNGDGAPVAALNWFGIHGTSMSNVNRHLSGDNKGYAAWRFERAMNNEAGPLYFQNDAPFVAGFFQGDEGDNSPNIHIAPLPESVLRDPESDAFQRRGGGRDDLESTKISGLKQFAFAKDLYTQANSPLYGPVRYIHAFMDFTALAVEPEFHMNYDPALDQTGARRTCEPAYGLSAPAGAEDGRAPLDEGQTCANTSGVLLTAWQAGLWTILQVMTGFDLPSGLASKVGCGHPVNEDEWGDFGCHAEKPIAAPLGHAVFDETQPIAARVIPLQIMQIGDLAVIGLPFEVTTTAARRIRTAMLDELEPFGVRYAQVAGLSNHYSHYLTTREEYASQQYEGGSTIFGAWQLDVVIQELSLLVRRELNRAKPGEELAPSHYQDSYRTHVTSLVHEPDTDNHFDDATVGTVINAPAETYALADTPVVSAAFVATNPRKDLRQNDTYGSVEMQTGPEWQTLAVDNDFSLTVTYDDENGTMALTWRPDENTKPGTYRLRHAATDSVTDSFTLTD